MPAEGDSPEVLRHGGVKVELCCPLPMSCRRGVEAGSEKREGDGAMGNLQHRSLDRVL